MKPNSSTKPSRDGAKAPKRRLPGAPSRRVIAAWLSGPLAFALGLGVSSAKVETTVYVQTHYEVRPHDEPIKYVFSGETRVARVTGSLKANTRLQRLRLSAGWNLCSVAVGGMPLPRRLTGQGTDFVTAAYRWGAVLRRWITVQTNESLAAGTVLWLRSTTNTILTLQGEYPEPANQIVRIGGSFHSSAGMNPLRLPSSSTDDDQALGQASFDAARQRWNSHHPSVPWIESGHPAFIGPGQAVFIQTETPTELEVPDVASRVRYYHQDHLGSSSIVTDADGQRISETAFYPFGESRHEVEEVEESYQFAQKERDLESGLDYLEARYLNAGLSRFASVDPKYLKPDSFSDSDLGSFLARPQELNLYAYAYNNPIRYHDPTGLDAKAALSTGNDVAGFMAGATEEAALWQSRTTPNFDLISGRTAKVVGAVGKVTAVVSITMKAKELYDKPSEATGAQFVNEAGKTLMGLAVAPVGLVWSFADIAGVGPSAILESTHNAIEHHKAATTAYDTTTALMNWKRDYINQKAPIIKGKLDEFERLVSHFNRKVAAGAPKLAPTDPSLKVLNAQIAKEEARLRKYQRQAYREWSKTRKLMRK